MSHVVTPIKNSKMRIRYLIFSVAGFKYVINNNKYWKKTVKNSKFNFKEFSRIKMSSTNDDELNISFSSTFNWNGCFAMMKLFKTIQYHFGYMGTLPIENQPKQYFNLINSFALFSYVQFIISSVAFLLFNVQTVNEYVQSFYACITSMSGVCLLLSSMFEKGHIFELIENCEKTIETSECLNHFILFK